MDVCGHVGIGVMARLYPLGMDVHHVSLGIEQWPLIIFPREMGGMRPIAKVLKNDREIGIWMEKETKLKKEMKFVTVQFPQTIQPPDPLIRED